MQIIGHIGIECRASGIIMYINMQENPPQEMCPQVDRELSGEGGFVSWFRPLKLHLSCYKTVTLQIVRLYQLSS